MGGDVNDTDGTLLNSLYRLSDCALVNA